MDYRFPKAISAARVATFVSTAAWIQGTSASEVSLPADALNNFLKRNGVSARQQQTPPADAVPEDAEESVSEEEEGENEAEDSSVSSSSEGTTIEGEDSDDGEEGEGGSEAEAAAINDPNQANVAVDPSGQPAIGSSNGPTLSTGAKAAIGVWVAVAVLSLGGLLFFLYRRRKRSRMLEEIRSVQDIEYARSQAPPMAEQGAAPSVIEPVYLRDGGGVGGGGVGGGGNSRPQSLQSGKWVATPPWQEEQPTWRASRPWMGSTPSEAPPPGLPANPSPRAQPGGGLNVAGNRASEYDRRTEYTADTESTIFAYR
ncbi:hypothetical protein F4778DRAFT_545985 [Xylariomycetidae sp. FL2044]|nr:hypothetical protein F4778DRAFT_545985 [Xylariomycetidae sp. FL2044]